MLSAQLCLTIITSHIYPYRPFFFSVHSLLFCAFSTLREAGNPILPPSSLPSAPPRTTTHLPAPTAPTSPQPGPPPALPPPHPAALGACPFPSARSAAMYSRHVPRLAARSGGGEKPWWLQPGDRRGAAAGSSTRTARPPRYSAKRKGAGEAPLRQSPPLPSALPRRDAGGSAPLLRAGHPP